MDRLDMLKPCPFCGTELAWDHQHELWWHGDRNGEGCILHTLHLEDADDVAFWNTRANLNDKSGEGDNA